MQNLKDCETISFFVERIKLAIAQNHLIDVISNNLFYSNFSLFPHRKAQILLDLLILS